MAHHRHDYEICMSDVYSEYLPVQENWKTGIFLHIFFHVAKSNFLKLSLIFKAPHHYATYIYSIDVLLCTQEYFPYVMAATIMMD